MYTQQQLQELVDLGKWGLLLLDEQQQLEARLAEIPGLIAENEAKIRALQGEAVEVTPVGVVPTPASVGPRTFGTSRKLLALVVEAATRGELPPLEYSEGAPSTLAEGMEFLFGSQWELSTVRYKGRDRLANDPVIIAWLQEYIPRVAELFGYAWSGEHPEGLQPDTHLAGAAKRIPMSVREIVIRLGVAMQLQSGESGLPDPVALEEEITWLEENQ